MSALDTPARPVLRYHGGKWRLAPWIIKHFPRHRVYVEPFCGAASVLLRKPRSYAEVLNDLDLGVTNLFQVLRSSSDAAALMKRLSLTPYARDEFEQSYEPSPDRVEEAARLVIRSFMGFGSDAASKRSNITGFRSTCNRSGTTPAHDWARYPDNLGAIVSRLRGVVIENRDALACMVQHDGNDTLHYVDPPYLPETRQLNHRHHGYMHEMSADQHVKLISELRKMSGMVVLSGYPHAQYDAMLYGWSRFERAAMADGARPRVEVLWVNRHAADKLAVSSDLFGAS